MYDSDFLEYIEDNPSITVRGGIVTRVGESFENMTGYNAGDFLNKNIKEVFEILRIGPDIDLQSISRKDGFFLFTRSLDVRFVNIETFRDTDSQIYVFIERQNQAIKQQKEMLEAILDNMQESLYVFDKDGRYITINKVAKQRHSVPFNTIQERYKIEKRYDMEGNLIPFEKMPGYRVMCGETVKNMFMRYEAEGQDYYAFVSGTPIFDEKGKFLYGIVSSLNMTDFMKNQHALEKTQEKLLIAEREKNETLKKTIEMKDDFLSLISHEFRTPLNVINTAIQALIFMYEDELSDRVKEYIGMIRQNTFRQLRLVNNLLDITRADAGRIKVHKKNIDIVFLTKSIAESVYTYASQKGVELTFASSIKDKVIGIDDEKYERILLNLLSNAIKFTPEGRSIAVKLYAVEKGICVEVKDNGIGIPEEKLSVIFKRFGQVDSSLSRQAEGAGIGLSLVKRFVEALGGSIDVKSKTGKGSKFTVFLPDDKVQEESEDQSGDLMDNHLVQTINVEFSDIYL